LSPVSSTEKKKPQKPKTTTITNKEFLFVVVVFKFWTPKRKRTRVLVRTLHFPHTMPSPPIPHPSYHHNMVRKQKGNRPGTEAAKHVEWPY
jgi:hypothetical protein